MNTVNLTQDPHYKATLSVALHGARLQFHVAQDLFSSAGLDPGSAALLRTLADIDATRVLDLGCGYGPLGLFLKAWNPERVVHMVDRDALAVRFAEANADLNELVAVETYPSLGYDDVRASDFDLITSNIPAKAGPATIEALLLDGNHFLRAGGTMAIVVISRLAPEVRATLDRAGVEVLIERENRGYFCVHYRYPARPESPYAAGFERGIYDRGRIRYDGVDVATVHGLPEFDTVGFATQLAVKVLPDLKASHVTVLNPGQGVVAATSARAVPTAVADRDLLAVRNAARNTALTEGAPTVVVAMLRQGEPVAVTQAAVLPYAPAHVLIAGSSTQVTRLVEAWNADEVTRKRNHGFSAAILTLSR